MTNLECAIAVLATHREARRWSDDAVAIDLLARLGLDAAGEVLSDAHPATEPATMNQAQFDEKMDALDAADPGPMTHLVERLNEPELTSPPALVTEDEARTADYKVQLDAALTPADEAALQV